MIGLQTRIARLKGRFQLESVRGSKVVVRPRNAAVRWATFLLVAIVSQPWVAQACSVCYGEPDSPASRGLTWAITALALTVVGVLSGVVAFFVHTGKNGQALEPGAGTNS